MATSAIAASPRSETRNASKSSQKSSHPWKRLLWTWIVGVCFAIVNFPTLLTKVLEESWGGPAVMSLPLGIIAGTQSLITALVGGAPVHKFQDLMSYCFLGVGAYLLALALLSLRHGRPRLFLLGIVGLLGGIVALHFISWLAFIVVAVLGWLLMVIQIIFEACAGAMRFLFLHGFWVVLLAIGAYVAYRYRKEAASTIGSMIATMIAVGVCYALSRVLGPLLRVLEPIFRWLGVLISLMVKWSLLTLGVFGVLSALGHLVIDQIKGAWYSGCGRKGVLLGGFAIGTALALILLNSVANTTLAHAVDAGWTNCWVQVDGWFGTRWSAGALSHTSLATGFAATMHPDVRAFVFQVLTAASAPLYDAVMLLVVLGVSCLGIARRLVLRLAEHEDVPVTFYPHEYLMICGGLLAAIVGIYVQALTSAHQTTTSATGNGGR